ncbi:hypothetical protein THRCLA_04407 [Thraustotheca clavata]|uniref:Rab-GAP TBC domain-containing protein n=1 Tax=Thraustotheca clavata TaxID=74557 RepID=A0A1V9ZZ55_9STRA|nr:hypothetical protein THRCLA_04407 [Thraustotheca clavata]
MPEDGATISGYLNKMKQEQKLLTPSWTRRWFSLEGAELKYYSTEQSLIPSKVIDLLSIDSVRAFDTGDHGVYSFILKTPTRSYLLRADSEGDMKRWLRRRYISLLSGLPIMDKRGRLLTCRYERLKELRRMVIVHGLPLESEEEANGIEKMTLRGRVWKMLLGLDDDNLENKQSYKRVVALGPSKNDADIRNDTFRTFRGDPSFAKRVPEDTLVRLLNAFIHQHGNVCKDGRDESEQPYRYFQGLNILCAPFLYVLPEEDAYIAFCALVTQHCPRYVAPQLAGVHVACGLVDRCLQTLDYKLYKHLMNKGITAKIYAYPIILSFFACIPPLPELLHVWDILLAMGVHFVVVLSTAHVILLRSELLTTDAHLMNKLNLRETPPLNAKRLIYLALQLLHRLPDDLHFEIARHPFQHPDSFDSICLPSSILDIVMEKVKKRKKTVCERRVPGEIKPPWKL